MLQLATNAFYTPETVAYPDFWRAGGGASDEERAELSLRVRAEPHLQTHFGAKLHIWLLQKPLLKIQFALLFHISISCHIRHELLTNYTINFMYIPDRGCVRILRTLFGYATVQRYTLADSARHDTQRLNNFWDVVVVSFSFKCYYCRYIVSTNLGLYNG